MTLTEYYPYIIKTIHAVHHSTNPDSSLKAHSNEHIADIIKTVRYCSTHPHGGLPPYILVKRLLKIYAIVF